MIFNQDFAIMFLLNYMIHSTILFVIIYFLLKLPSLQALKSKEVLWKFAMIGALMSSSLQSITNTGFLSLEAPSEQVLVMSEPNFGMPDEYVIPASEEESSEGYAISFEQQEADLIDWKQLVLLSVLLISATGVLRFLYVRRRFLKKLEMRALNSSEVTAIFSKLKANLKYTSQVEIYVSRKLKGPIAFAGNKLCLPLETWEQLNNDEKESILAHELAHLFRKDPSWLFLMNILTAAFFFQPLNRIVRKRIKDIMEESSDQKAVELTRNVVVFSETLIKVARWTEQRALNYSLNMAANTALNRRIRALLDETPSQNSRLKPVWFVGIIVLVLTIMSIASPGFSVKVLAPENHSNVDTAPLQVITEKTFPGDTPSNEESKKAVNGVDSKEENSASELLSLEDSEEDRVSTELMEPIRAFKDLALMNPSSFYNNLPKPQKGLSGSTNSFVTGSWTNVEANYESFKRDFWPALLNSKLANRRKNTVEITHGFLVINTKRISEKEFQPFKKLVEKHFGRGYWPHFQYKRENFKTGDITTSMKKWEAPRIGHNYSGLTEELDEISDRQAEMEVWALYRLDLAETLVRDGFLRSKSDRMRVKWRKDKVFINGKKFTGDRFLRYRAIKDRYLPISK